MKNIQETNENGRPTIRRIYLRLRETKSSQWNNYRRYS